MATQDQRDHLHAIMKWLLAHRSKVGYRAHRPMSTFVPALLLEQDCVDRFNVQGGAIALDCSEMVTLLCRWAGLKDPTGYKFTGYGNSTSMYYFMTKRYTEPSRAHTGAIVVFGPSGGNHAAMVMDGGVDPVLFSHGSSHGPIAIKLSAYRAAEPRQSPVTFLDIGRL